jgi:hypothetical protein
VAWKLLFRQGWRRLWERDCREQLRLRSCIYTHAFLLDSDVRRTSANKQQLLGTRSRLWQSVTLLSIPGVRFTLSSALPTSAPFPDFP